MGGEGQINAALGRVCSLTFPQATGITRVLLDANYVCAVGMKLFPQLFATLLPAKTTEYVLCRLVDDAVVWVEDDEALLEIFHDEGNQCETLHAVISNKVQGMQAVVRSHMSPEFSPELDYLPMQTPDETKAEAETQIHTEEERDEDNANLNGMLSLSHFEEPQQQNEAKAEPINLFDSIRLFFDQPKKKESDKKKESGKNWWSASTQFLMKPFTEKAKKEEEIAPTPIPDMTYRHSEPVRPLSASYQVLYPRMSYVHDEEAETAPRHNFHISSSWHQQADRMSASLRVSAKEKEKNSTMGSFVWI
ncbi:unnamed protein product [Aphanomyces euteiches]|uniref:Uncharacterized protein n=1 Tax=Aphanomyces euteiches TaxID=100861 RepID=A0A6G0WF75_9STRA|nr:hypothetical protein Ae201684_015895 [Aphanomyces euteiches]KAH9080140.1 hypothetical protein Ae201684P_009086 [Aphanomyces euteiches]KAH9153028.1 hypothetical protein AeRB84_004648 [Aphanomyces euteiches]